MPHERRWDGRSVRRSRSCARKRWRPGRVPGRQPCRSRCRRIRDPPQVAEKSSRGVGGTDLSVSRVGGSRLVYGMAHVWLIGIKHLWRADYLPTSRQAVSRSLGMCSNRFGSEESAGQTFRNEPIGKFRSSELNQRAQWSVMSRRHRPEWNPAQEAVAREMTYKLVTMCETTGNEGVHEEQSDVDGRE